MKHYTHNVLAEFYNHHYSKGKMYCPTIPTANDVQQAMAENYDRQTNEVGMLDALRAILTMKPSYKDNEQDADLVANMRNIAAQAIKKATGEVKPVDGEDLTFVEKYGNNERGEK